MSITKGKLGEEDNQIERGRIDYIREIVSKLCSASRSNLLPTTTQENFIEKALRYVVCVVSRDEVLFRGISSSYRTTWNRKQCLNEIFNQLSCMERHRLYSPPADNEIEHYLLIKKYTRPILAFFSDGPAISAFNIRRALGCVSFFTTLHYAEELTDLTQHLAEFSGLLLKKGVNDDFTLKPIMGTEGDSRMTLTIHGAKSRNYKYYAHKFFLAMVDLRCSEYALVPPFEDEKAAYLEVLDSIPLPLIGIQDHEMITSCSDVLNQLFLERIYQETSDVMSHCDKLKGWILKDLSLTKCWESLQEKYREEKYEELVNIDDYLSGFKKALAEKYCQVLDDELPNYISRLQRCIRIAKILLLYVMCIIEDESSTFHLNGLDKSAKAWEALHALTLLKGCRIGESSEICLELPQDKEISENVQPNKSQDENLQLLRGTIEDLKRIGSLNAQVDEEEMTLVQKIWGSVASSTHFFTSALAYDQKRYLLHRSDLLDVQILGLKSSSRREKSINMEELQDLEYCFSQDMYDLVDILQTYKDILVSKLTSLQSTADINS